MKTMPPEHPNRKLAAILSADAKGYSRLMEDDDEATVVTLTAYRRVLAEVIGRHRGRVVDSPGDNLLAEFASVVDAVRGAVEIQEELRLRNADLPESRRMQFRIGINLGDVIEEEGRLYGEGVNIAARIEGLAPGGGICVSGSAYEQIKNKLALEAEYLGKREVKNISEPIRVYRLALEPATARPFAARNRAARRARPKWSAFGAVGLLVAGLGAVALWKSSTRPEPPAAETAPTRTENLELPDIPSIAVLPFDNMSGDPEQEYFSDGITEDLTTGLSKVSGLFVIARNSAFAYKGRSVKVEAVGRELGVRFVLEGSVRKVGERVRITAQLIDASTGYHLWAERYDRQLAEIFDVQDEVTQKIITALAVQLTEDETDRATRIRTVSTEAYEYTLRGMEYRNRKTRSANELSREMFLKAVELDPEYAEAYSELAHTYLMEWIFGWDRNEQALEKAAELGNLAITLDPSLPTSHALLGYVFLWKKDHDRAVEAMETAIELDPNDADGYAGLADVLCWTGNPEVAVDLIKKAMRLNPAYPDFYLRTLAHAQYLTRRYGEAIESFREMLHRSPDFVSARIYLIAIDVEQGRTEKAREQVAALISEDPDISEEGWEHRLPYKNRAVLDRLYDALRVAGLQ